MFGSFRYHVERSNTHGWLVVQMWLPGRFLSKVFGLEASCLTFVGRKSFRHLESNIPCGPKMNNQIWAAIADFKHREKIRQTQAALRNETWER